MALVKDPDLFGKGDNFEHDRSMIYLTKRELDSPRPIISITVRNKSRPSSIKGINTGSWGRNLRCRECNEIVAYNNHRGSDADRYIRIVAGEHLYEKHLEHTRRRTARTVEIAGVTPEELRKLIDRVRTEAASDNPLFTIWEK